MKKSIEQIQEMISDGTLKAGDKLLPERDLAEMLGVSRGFYKRSYKCSGSARCFRG
ncbi:FadR/GntR family transcriptional regulator [Syntrophaceticus schinkii]|uniref:Transcriptional regulator, GntR family, putative (Part 1) n=1 Tax=Syntrophaceticus schinkii TaxID=499207 RepID=A0A0B7MJT0_9FIRM|nr:Transcriptional regulator, GntR family, putative (Part 1) [Syntrophaceticus schinkii]